MTLTLVSRESHCQVHLVGAITRELDGSELSDIAGIAAVGVGYLSDDGRPLASSSCADLARTQDPACKVNPPLQSLEDVEAVRRGLRDGIIDVIAADHASHTARAKGVGWHAAPCGMVELETALPVSFHELVPDTLTVMQLVNAMSAESAEIMGLVDQGGPLTPGAAANIAVFAPAASWTVDRSELLSASKNTPFTGFRVRGRVMHTLVDGASAYSDGALVGVLPRPGRPRSVAAHTVVPWT